MKLVVKKEIKYLVSLTFYLFSATSLIKSVKHEHSCTILYVLTYFTIILLANGGWSDWTDWTLCSKTCGSGVAVRHRQCDSPPPDTDGQPCIGPDRETQTCNTEQCPGRS